MKLDGLPLPEFYNQVVNDTTVSTDPFTESLSRQLIWKIGFTIESKIMVKFGAKSASPNNDTEDCALVEETQVWAPKNWRAVDRELSRYIDATKNALAGGQRVSG